MTGLPDGFEVGHWTDRERLTGATVVLTPPGTVAAGEVRGGAPGTRETDLLSPASSAAEVHAVLFTGGSAFGLAAADGVVSFLAERGRGSATPVGPVPLVPAAVVFDLMLGAEDAYPDRDAGYAACAAAAATFQRGSVGAGTGCTVGKLLGPAGATKAGVGYAAFALGGALVGALAVVNAFGDVRDSDGALLTGVWRDGRHVPTVELLLEGESMPSLVRQATTLVCILTDAALTKTDCWRVARAGSAASRARSIRARRHSTATSSSAWRAVANRHTRWRSRRSPRMRRRKRSATGCDRRPGPAALPPCTSADDAAVATGGAARAASRVSADSPVVVCRAAAIARSPVRDDAGPRGAAGAPQLWRPAALGAAGRRGEASRAAARRRRAGGPRGTGGRAVGVAPAR
jgi:L-aminopeptidase/D-esterase-like protein